ncbi:MAG: transposase [Pseudomonadota bacterium]
MLRSFILFISTIATLTPGLARAEPLPGVDDPALVAAAEQWLAEDDPIEALREIGRIAVAGNLAAQHFANSVDLYERGFGSATPMSRSERLKLFPPSAGDDRTVKTRPYEVDFALSPALAATRKIGITVPLAERIAVTETLLSGGLRQVALSNTTQDLSTRPNEVEVFQLAEAATNDPAISVMADMFNPIHKALCAATDAMDKELKIIARESNLARCLMTVPGVGPMTALSFIATIDDVQRFKRSRDVGAFLGLTPRRHQSGDMDWSGRISKCGDRDLRRLLYSAATTLITQVRKPSPLLVWARRPHERKGFEKAAVAASRKLAVILHCIWRDGTLFEPNMEAQA